MTTNLYPFEGTVANRTNPFEGLLQKCGQACDRVEYMTKLEQPRHYVTDLCRQFAAKCEAALEAHEVVNFERGRVEEFARLFGAVKENGAYDLNLRALLKFNRNR